MACALSHCPIRSVPSTKYQAGAFLGVLGVLFVLAKTLTMRSGQVPVWPLARRQYAARGAPQTFPPRLAAEHGRTLALLAEFPTTGGFLSHNEGDSEPQLED